MTTPLDAALSFASDGWPVFPCKPGAKQPATRHGFEDATTDPDTIRRWWHHDPAYNVAIPTGVPTLDVLDVDVKPTGTGFPAFRKAKSAGLLAGALALVQTPSRGLHAYYAGTEQGCGKLVGHHLDFKATGGYVLVPSSVVNGKPYEWLERREIEPARLDWPAIRRLIDPPQPIHKQPAGRAASDVTKLAEWVARQPEGNRNEALFWAACRVVETGADTEETGSALLTAAVTAGQTEREARRTIASARKRIGGRS